MQYEQYLFSQLTMLFDFDFESMPYDLQFAESLERYQDFEQSEFNVATKGLYECIVDYLKNKYHKQLN